jgi:hypothetical protein
VLTLFGCVLYSARNSWATPRQSLEEIASDPNGIIASNDKKHGRANGWNDAEVSGINLAFLVTAVEAYLHNLPCTGPLRAVWRA